ncbi:hypothetical protein BKA69DRAFT_476650 [Paraphysoderma sedebokerense]|nr:hypothetical protein BKA69DRAFT_476650 [Paraphysoderma sedebokerense]
MESLQRHSTIQQPSSPNLSYLNSHPFVFTSFRIFLKDVDESIANLEFLEAVRDYVEVYERFAELIRIEAEVDHPLHKNVQTDEIEVVSNESVGRGVTKAKRRMSYRYNKEKDMIERPHIIIKGNTDSGSPRGELASSPRLVESPKATSPRLPQSPISAKLRLPQFPINDLSRLSDTNSALASHHNRNLPSLPSASKLPDTQLTIETLYTFVISILTIYFAPTLPSFHLTDQDKPNHRILTLLKSSPMNISSFLNTPLTNQVARVIGIHASRDILWETIVRKMEEHYKREEQIMLAGKDRISASSSKASNLNTQNTSPEPFSLVDLHPSIFTSSVNIIQSYMYQVTVPRYHHYIVQNIKIESFWIVYYYLVFFLAWCGSVLFLVWNELSHQGRANRIFVAVGIFWSSLGYLQATRRFSIIRFLSDCQNPVRENSMTPSGSEVTLNKLASGDGISAPPSRANSAGVSGSVSDVSIKKKRRREFDVYDARRWLTFRIIGFSVVTSIIITAH